MRQKKDQHHEACTKRKTFSLFKLFKKGAIVCFERNSGSPLYLEPNSGSMQKPIEGRSALSLYTLFKGEEATVLSSTPESITKQALFSVNPKQLGKFAAILS